MRPSCRDCVRMEPCTYPRTKTKRPRFPEALLFKIAHCSVTGADLQFQHVMYQLFRHIAVFRKGHRHQ